MSLLLLKSKFEVLNEEVKTGTSARGDWTINEYLLKHIAEREDGSIVETHLNASTTETVGKLEVGAEYEMTICVTSRASTDGTGKERHWSAFRCTRAAIVGTAKEKAVARAEESKTAVAALGDDIPF